MGAPSRIAVVVKGYPRLSETFIAQELLGARAARPRPADRLAAPPDRSAPMHDAASRDRGAGALSAGISVSGAAARAARLVAAAAHAALPRDAEACGSRTCGATAPPTGCAASARPWCWPPRCRPTSASSTRIMRTRRRRSRAMPPRLSGRRWCLSAHAKDIWTTPAWELREKLADCQWAHHLHRAAMPRICAPWRRAGDGADLSRPGSAPFSGARARPGPDGSDPARPVRLLGVARLVPKKGIEAAAGGAGGAAAQPGLALRARRRRPAAGESCGPRRRALASPIGSPGTARSPQDRVLRGLSRGRSVRAGQPDRAGRRSRRPAERAARGGRHGACRGREPGRRGAGADRGRRERPSGAAGRSGGAGRCARPR